MTHLRLDLQYFAGEKTEKATPQKRLESRKKGEVAKSQEVPSAFILFGSALALYLLGGWYLERILALFQFVYQDLLLTTITVQNLPELVNQLLIEMVILATPLFVIAIIFGIGGTFVQIGFLFAPEAVFAKLSRINPISGAKRIFSLRALVELVKSILKVVVIATAAGIILWTNRDTLMGLSHLPIRQSTAAIGQLTFQLFVTVAIILVVLAVADYMYQKYEFEKQIRMSKQDLKDEFKKTEGDPLIKSKIKEKQRQMSLNRMIQDLPRADVLITNPTHFAVALAYDDKTMEAPTVIAMGMDFQALKLREKAKEFRVTIVENKPLARALYDQTDIGDPVPEELFGAVAEILAYVYRINGRLKGGN
ncbi:flagellar biosynthesis protein FlhB [Chryseomicrobium palamuruense]